MKRLYSTQEHYQVKRALWEDVKDLPLPRKVRLLMRDELYLEWVEALERRNQAEDWDEPAQE